MEAAAMRDENAMCPSDIGRPRSCREKFVQKWNEKQKLQQPPLSSPQVPECQAAVDIPTQGQMTSDRALSLREASLHPSKNAVYFLIVSPASQEQQPLSPFSTLATEHCLQQLSMTFYQTERDCLDNKLASRLWNWETNAEEEFVQICTSDLLLACPVKRPRLLPPNRKMHVEVRKKEASYPLQDSASSPTPLEYSHLPNTRSITNPPNIPKVECTYCRFPSELEKEGSCRRDRPGYHLAECPSPAWSMTAPSSEQAVRMTDRMRPEQQQSPERSAPTPDLEMADKWSQNKHLPPKKRYKHLPPKKRYTRGCL